MAGKFGGYGDDDDDVLAPKEPQVTSQDPEERKQARALRIKKRQEALKRAEQQSEEAAAEEEPGLIEQATAFAAEELQRLALDGAAKVTNVKVTTDEREVIRRALFSENMRNNLKKIEEEAAEAQLKYEAITAHWDAMLEVKDPLDIDAEIKAQREKCDDLLAQKNQLVQELKHDLKMMDQAYYDDLDKQDKDIKELSERIEKQVTIMQRAYETQLSLIEHAINMERDAMLDHNNKRWEALYKQRDREEVAHMEYKFDQLEEHKQELEAIMWDHHEKYREARIELESLAQELQKELEKLKATCIINTEKIGYNYQVLKKREEENVFVRSQQKRKLNKMSDVANTLRAKIRKAAVDGALEEIKADTEIVKLMQTMDDLEKKSEHFSHVNNYKFSQVWRMSSGKCAQMSRDLRQAEVALHAHILSEPPPPPPPPPPKSPLTKYEHEMAQTKPSTVISVGKNADANSRDRLVRHILQLVADNTGFLVEDRLLKLIEKYQLTSRNLCTLDAIFMALEIQGEEDVELLCKTFLNYAFCPICIGKESTSEMMEESFLSQEDSRHASIGSKQRQSIKPHMSLTRSMSASTNRSTHVGFKSHELSPADQMLIAEAEEILQKFGDAQHVSHGGHARAPGHFVIPGKGSETAVSGSGRRHTHRGVTVSAGQPECKSGPPKTANPFLCSMGHNLEIEPMQVLTALGEFIEVFVPPEKKKLFEILNSVKPPDFSTPSRRLTTEEIEQYWNQWKNAFPAEKDRFWDGLLSGLNNYLNILQERERLHDEVVGLRRRNAALRRLVRGALPDLPGPAPRYARAPPVAFTAAYPDDAPMAFDRLPPI